jgi:hypothetical protein
VRRRVSDRRGGSPELVEAAIQRVGLILAIGFVALVSPGPGSSQAAAHEGCVGIEQGLFVGEGKTVHVSVGAVVRVNLVEPEGYLSRGTPPRGFPWSSPRSSNAKVLSRAPYCPHRPFRSSLPESPASFRAMHAGTAEIQAPLVASWRSLSPEALGGLTPPQAFRATVIVMAR